MSNKFYRIPGYSMYRISRKGVVKSLKFNFLLYGSRNPAGYVNFRISADGEKAKTVGRHVLIALAFKHPGHSVDDLVVNHKNGIKGDDRPGNLEFITRKENCEHAGLNGLSEKCKPCQVRNVLTGETTFYPSFIELAKAFGISKDVASFRCKSKGKISYDGFCFRTLSEEPWPKHGLKGFYVKCMITDTVNHYPNMKTTAKAIKVSESWFSRQFKSKNQALAPGFKLVKVSSTSEPWPSVIDPILESQKVNGHRALITVDINGKVKLFLNSIELAVELSEPKANVAYWASSKDKKFIKGYKIYYYSSEILSSLNLSNCGKALLKDYLLQRSRKRQA